MNKIQFWIDLNSHRIDDRLGDQRLILLDIFTTDYLPAQGWFEHFYAFCRWCPVWNYFLMQYTELHCTRIAKRYKIIDFLDIPGNKRECMFYFLFILNIVGVSLLYLGFLDRTSVGITFSAFPDEQV